MHERARQIYGNRLKKSLNIDNFHGRYIQGQKKSMNFSHEEIIWQPARSLLPLQLREEVQNLNQNIKRWKIDNDFNE